VKILLGMVFVLSTIFANTTNTTKKQNESLNSIYENIILKNSKKSIVDIKRLQNHILANETNKAKEEFVNLVKSWKSVQAFYILGDLDDNYLDTPRYIDIFHEGNEDIKKQLDLILTTDEDLKIAHFKNSQKTINALEYMLFTKDLKTKRVKDIVLRITNKLTLNLQDIYDGYVDNKAKFLKDEIASNAIMLNSLIENSYKIKEWRVGDPSGLSRKFRGKKDNRNAEYYISKNSIVAVRSILNTHLMVLGSQRYKNFGDMIKSYKVKKELNNAVKYINISLENTKLIINDDFENTKNTKPLYKSLKKLHMTYYISLIGKLKITAKILDADGD